MKKLKEKKKLIVLLAHYQKKHGWTKEQATFVLSKVPPSKKRTNPAVLGSRKKNLLLLFNFILFFCFVFFFCFNALTFFLCFPLSRSCCAKFGCILQLFLTISPNRVVPSGLTIIIPNKIVWNTSYSSSVFFFKVSWF